MSYNLFVSYSHRHFAVKLTPINPTRSALRARLLGRVDPDAPEPTADLVARFRAAGYETILSIGELRENQIGSNCGMYAATR